MKINLSFSLAHVSEKREVIFPSVELKQAYVLAESSDIRCKQAYLHFQAAKDKEERKKRAQELDGTRYAFFERWAKKHMPKSPSPIRPIDDRYLA